MKATAFLPFLVVVTVVIVIVALIGQHLISFLVEAVKHLKVLKNVKHLLSVVVLVSYWVFIQRNVAQGDCVLYEDQYGAAKTYNSLKLREVSHIITSKFDGVQVCILCQML